MRCFDMKRPSRNNGTGLRENAINAGLNPRPDSPPAKSGFPAVMNFPQVTSLLAQVGPILNPLEIEASEPLRTWAISMPEDLAVLVQFDEAKNCLVLASELGAPPPGDRTALYEILLQINFHWDTTGGTRMAINGPGGEIVQVYEIGTDGLEATRLSAILSSFAAGAKAWRELIQRRAATPGSPPDATPESMPDLQTFLQNRC